MIFPNHFDSSQENFQTAFQMAYTKQNKKAFQGGSKTRNQINHDENSTLEVKLIWRYWIKEITKMFWLSYHDSNSITDGFTAPIHTKKLQ